MTGQQFSNLDNVLFRMDNPVDPMLVTGILVTGAPVDIEQLKALIQARILRFNRFRQRVVPSRRLWKVATWEDAPELDLDYHVQRVTLPPPGDQAALQRTVSELAATPLDMARPPWQMHLVEKYGPGSALICRPHHSLADGVALIHVLLSLTDTSADGSQSGPGQAYAPRTPSAVRSSEAANRRGLARSAKAAMSAVGDIVLTPPDSSTVLRGVQGLPKRIAWSGPLPLADIKTIGRRLGGTVNDVLLAVLTGALRRYVQGRQDLPADVFVRVVMPINLRPAGAEVELGNRISAVFLRLPVEIVDPAERLAVIKQRMDALKGSLQPAMVLTALQIVSRAPSAVLAWALRYLCSKASVLVTNVKGPQEGLYMAGASITEMMAWIPRYGGIGVGITILSYDGQVRLGVVSDVNIVSDPENMIAAFRGEFDALLAVALEMEQPPSANEPPAMQD